MSNTFCVFLALASRARRSSLPHKRSQTRKWAGKIPKSFKFSERSSTIKTRKPRMVAKGNLAFRGIPPFKKTDRCDLKFCFNHSRKIEWLPAKMKFCVYLWSCQTVKTTPRPTTKQRASAKHLWDPLPSQRKSIRIRASQCSRRISRAC